MNKYRLRAFSFGIIFAVCIIGIYYYLYYETNVIQPEEKTFTVEDAKEIITKNDLVVLSEDELNELKSASEQLKELKKEKDTKKKKKKPKDKVKVFELEVKTGLTSTEIAAILKEEKIIKDEAEFIDFLAINGYSKSIQLGKFTLTDKMSYEEIAEIITK